PHQLPVRWQRRFRQGDRPVARCQRRWARHPQQALFNGGREWRGEEPRRRGSARQGRDLRRRGPPEGAVRAQAVTPASPVYGLTPAAEATAMSGLAFLQAMIEGRLPSPPFSLSTGIRLSAAEHGRALFEG